MAKRFIHSDLFLKNDLAARLYHDHAKDLPAIDFHNHLDPKHLATNHRFGHLAEAWIQTDPYKHRAMRIAGIQESGITGSDTDQEKFRNWAKTLIHTVGNPLYVWSALELYRVFGVDECLTTENAEEIWAHGNALLGQEGYGAVDILKKFNAEILCTSDDLLGDLYPHVQATAKYDIRVFPSLRADLILAVDQPQFRSWTHKLEDQTGVSILSLADYKMAICRQLERFAAAGCRLADHAIDGGFVFEWPTEGEATSLFSAWKDGKELNPDQAIRLKCHLLSFLGGEYARHGWVLQMHIGAQRFTSSRLRKLTGSAGGYATIGKSCDVAGLCTFFDNLEKQERLPRVLLYTLHPGDNELFATLTGSFTEDHVWGKIQFGPAWWYNDHYAGIRKQLEALANYGLLSGFVGMTTDSRSVFSFSRHEYFRRILCGQIAAWVDEGHLPDDRELLGRLVEDISYYNSKQWIFNEQRNESEIGK